MLSKTLLYTGRIERLNPNGFGFISAENVDKQVYFRREWYAGTTPLAEGDLVHFKIKSHPDGRLTAKELRREGETSRRLLEWADLGHIPEVLHTLKKMALDETWSFRGQPDDPDYPYPILYSYLIQTFSKLVLDGSVLESEDGQFSAFNTGLVDHRYEPIFALFESNGSKAPRKTSPQWRFSSFCVPGEKTGGQTIYRTFQPLPDRAHYFENPSELFYNAREGAPGLDSEHLIIERIDRYPMEFLKQHCPRGFTLKDPTRFHSKSEREEYATALGKAIEADDRVYRSIINRVKDATDLATKRVSWNFRTAVPQYYPDIRRLQLLLPLCLVSDERVDIALAVEKTEKGKYLGHTVLPLDWAYSNARLICRPDSDWLEPTHIDVQDIDEDSSLGDGLSTH